MTNNPILVLAVDDHSMVLEGLKNIFASIPNVQLVATAGNAVDAIAILRHHAVEIAFVDINLPEINGIELCTKIKKEFPAVHVIGLSTFKQRTYVSQMIQHGASGYLLKSADKEEIEEAITTVLKGRMYFSKGISQIEPAADETPILTRREKEILQLIAEGLTNHEIAKKLFVSSYTVDTHRKNLLSKFDVGNTALLIKIAANQGLL